MQQRPRYSSYRQYEPPKRRRFVGLKRVLLVVTVAVVAVVLLQHFLHATIAAPSAKVSNKQAIKKPEPKPHVDAGLQKAINDWAATQSKNYTIDVHEVDHTLRTASYKSDQSMVTASTYKLYVAYGILSEIKQGTLTMQSRTNVGLPVQTCMERMIVNSDNTCGGSLGHLYGWVKLDTLLTKQGITKNTDLNNYDANGQLLSSDKTSTAADLTELLVRLQAGKLLTPSDTDYLLGLMKRQEYRERIPAGVPEDVVVADKPGFLGYVQADAGIVYGPKSTYVLTVMSDDSVPQPIAALSKIVYDYLQQ